MQEKKFRGNGGDEGKKKASAFRSKPEERLSWWIF
jgi:hypothetical protein